MSPVLVYPYDSFLRDRMEELKIHSFRQLAIVCGVSLHAIKRLRREGVKGLSIEVAACIAEGLELSLLDFLTGVGYEFKGRPCLSLVPIAMPSDYQREYEYLKVQLLEQRQKLYLEFQQEAIDRLETWLRNWPKVVHTIAQEKPDLLAVKILPLLKPLECLLQDWGVMTIGQIGDRLAFDPSYHQLITHSDPILPGAIVEVQRPGYLHQNKLLFRAEVVPMILV